ncbi:Cytochrome P450 CYP12A2 [Lucilia cuprina]|nr:Cytochrome P450 CYP12A2 [Lucilia cuprina]
MSSSICTHFSQNAWKKDLCSNCFKSKDEHKQAAAMAASSKYKSLSTSLAQSTSATSLSTKTGGSDSHKTDYPNKNKRPAKSIIKKSATNTGSKSKHKSKVSFPKNLSEVIGYGGEWSDDSDDDHDFMNLANDRDDDKALGTDDEESLELKRLTRANTDFNMNNGNLLGDAQENIKKSFAALKLGAPQVDKEGKKQTLQINVIPFGCTGEMKEITKSPVLSTQITSSASTVKAKFENKSTEVKTEKSSLTGAIKKTTTTTTSTSSCSSSLTSSSSCLKPSPDSLPSLESTLTESLDNKTFLDLKKPIVRHSPITKDQIKPKVNVFHKYSDSDSNCSDSENGVSAYYDVVETSQTYENLPDGKYEIKEPCKQSNSKAEQKEQSSIFSSSQYITDMLLSSKTRAASYNLHEGNFMTSKITPDGLIVTKCSSDDALDSTASSFDGSSDEETSYNMIRSESDSGIGISIGHDYKNINITEKERDRLRVEKKLSASTNNSDYEDIQVTDSKPMLPLKEVKSALNDKPTFSMEKSRELHGEPDGSADPDGSLENQDFQQLPELPKSPPPTSKVIDARPSFLHGLQKQHPPVLLKKPDLPAKPLVSPLQTPMKTFMSKRPTAPTTATTMTTTEQHQQQQVISQLQMVMSKSSECLDNDSLKDDAKLKKGKAPNPPMETKTSAPPTPERDYNIDVEFDEQTKKETQTQMQMPTPASQASTTPETQAVNLNKNDEDIKYKTESDNTTTSSSASSAESSASTETNCSTASNSSSSSSSTIYTRKIVSNSGTVGKNSAAAIIKEKDKRERATINPKFRSLNTFVTQRSNAIKNLQLQNAVPSLNLKQSMTPEPTPRNPKNLSLSEENLAEASSSKTVTTSMSITNLNAASHSDKKTAAMGKTKTKFSIKKFLRMGTNKTTENLTKQKESIYSEICTGEDAGVSGKPRLVIIHPIDINTTAVEVVKDITKTNESVTAQTVAVVTAKPPAPPLRSLDSQRSHEVNKPARPPPPKSAELRRKQQISLATTNTTTTTASNNSSSSAANPSYVNHNVNASATTANNLKMLTSSPKPTPANNIRIMGEQSGSIKSKSDNVYANLGEIRSSIAPRKPERTASMREREAQLELARKRHMGGTQQQQQHNHQQQQLINKENGDTISICSSNGENVSTEQQHSTNSTTSMTATTATTKNLTNFKSPQLSSNSMRLEGKPPTGSRTSTFERKKNEAKPNMSNKLEIFENTSTSNGPNGSSVETRPSSLKDSVRKINSTIDSYLKDKRDYENMYEFVKSPQSPPPPPARSADVQAGQQRLMQSRRNNLQLDNISVASYTRSEYGPARNFGLNNSLANIPRMISNSYCGSEMGDLDIYSPYSYYGSETGGDIGIKNRAKTTNRLRMRKGRSVVHKTIEDNYSAVVGANHEALAQVLEQLQQTPVIPPALRPLANAINLRFEDFTILEGAQAFVVGKKAFHAAIWTTAPVTLALSADCNQLAGVGGELNQLSGGVSGALNPITEFCDVVPCYHLPLMPTTEMTLLQATISVLPRLQLDTLQSIGAILKGKSQVLDKSNFNFRGSIPNLNTLKDANSVNNIRNGMSVQNLSTLNEESADKVYTGDGEAVSSSNGIPAFDDVMTREVAFIMLQLINGMKNLQVKAVEEMPLSLSNVVLSKEYDNKDAQARLCVLQGNNNDEDEPMGTLCKCAHVALTEMLPSTKITPILADILLQERSESLSKSKSVLEFILWGPSDVALTGSVKERETALQRWLDLERATVLHGLLLRFRSSISTTITEQDNDIKTTFSSEWQTAKPFEEIPTMSSFQLIRKFLPGGKYHKLDTTQFLMALREDLGSFCKIPGSFGQTDIVFTHNVQDFETLLRNEGIWPKRVGLEALNYHRSVYRADYFQGTEGLLATHGEKWGSFRSAVNPILMQPKNVRLYLRKMSQVNKEFLERIRQIRDPNTLEMPDTFEEEINRWTLESVSVVALDKQLGLITKNRNNPMATKMFATLNEFIALSLDVELKPSIWRYYKTKTFKKLMNSLDTLLDITTTYINEAIERLERERLSGAKEKAEHEKSVLEKLLKIDKKIATVMAMDMLMAGVDTSSSTFAGLLLCLAKNPEKQAKLREEVMQILPHKDSEFTEEACKNMPYLRACIKESLRVYPLTVGNARSPANDVVLSGYRIPKNTRVSMVSIALLRDENHFPRANEYLPERWLRMQKETNTNQMTTSAHPLRPSCPFVYLPFGFGPRTCIGRRIVEMELELGIARIVRNFQIEFNHPTDNAFKSVLMNVPNIPLKFKFTDIDLRLRSTAAIGTNTETNSFKQEWENAKPFKEIPSYKKLSDILKFLPGGKYYKMEPTKLMLQLKKDMGNIMRFDGYFGRKNGVITHNVEDFITVFRNEGIWPIRPGSDALHYHRSVHRADFFRGTEGIISTQNEKWANFRSTVNPVLMQPKNVRLYMDKMSLVNKEFIERIRQMRDPQTFEVPASFEEEMNRWTLESVSVVALDKQLGLMSKNRSDPLAKELFKAISNFFIYGMEVEYAPPIWKYYKNKSFKNLMKCLDTITLITSKYVNEAIERLEENTQKGGPEKPEHEKSVLEKLIKIDKKIATVMAMDMLMAGVDTTSSTFTGLLLCLAKNPQKQAKLREEIMKILPLKDSEFTEESLRNIPYLRACIKESLRLYPILIGNSRITTNDMVLSGYQIPKDTQISMISCAIVNDDKYFPRAKEFLPERWLRVEENNSTGCPLKPSSPFAFLPFGFGPRSCIGRRIVEMELELGIARVIRNFQVEYNYPTENAFKSLLINVPNIPLKFKFTDIDKTSEMLKLKNSYIILNKNINSNLTKEYKLLIIKQQQPAVALRFQSTSSAAAFKNDDNSDVSAAKKKWQNAKPFHEIPTISIFSMFKNFLPGGKYANLDTTQMMEALRKDLGNVAYLPGFLGRKGIVITHNVDDFEVVLRNEGIWPYRPGSETLHYHRHVHRADFFQGVEGLISTQGETWGTFRSAVNPVMIQPKNVRMYLHKMSQVNKEFIERIRQIRDPKTLEVPDSFEEEINRWTLESVSVVALDKQLGLITKNRDNPAAKELFQALNDFFMYSLELEFKPSLWRYYKTKTFMKLMEILDKIVAITSSYVNEAIERIEEDRKNGVPEKPDNEKSVLEKLINIDKKIATTTTTFTGLMLCLAKNPAKQEKLRQEILKILPQKDSEFDENALKNIPYLRACIKESQRIYPLALGNARAPANDIVISGYRIPKGTPVSLCTVSLIRNSDYYPQPNVFLPERWLRSNKNNDNNSECPHNLKPSNPFVHLPFGFGARSCIGRRIVELELELGIARLVRNYQIEFNYSTDNAFKSLLINFALKVRLKMLKLKNSCVILNKNTTKFKLLLIKQQHQQHLRYRSTAPAAALETEVNTEASANKEWQNAKPFEEIPTIGSLALLRKFLPGGKYANLDSTQMLNAFKEDLGNVAFLPGFFGREGFVITHNVEDFEKILRNEGIWPVRPGSDYLQYHRHGETWGKFRSTVNPVMMQPKNVRLYLHKMSQVNKEFIERIRQIRDPQTFEVPDNFEEEMNRWTLESVSVVALDKQLGLITKNRDNPAAKELFQALNDFFTYSVEVEFKPSLWRYIKTPTFKKLMAALDKIVDITSSYVNEAIERIEEERKNGVPEKPENEKSVLEKLIKIDKKIATTSSTFTGLLLCMAKNPDKQQKLREEVLKVLPHKDSEFNENSIKNMPYLRACIKESLRYYPLIVGNARVPVEDVVVSGYRVPKGTQVSMCATSLTRDGKHYPHPNEYLPERWLRSDKETNDSSACPQSLKPSTPFLHLPFGFGARSCIGRRIVEMELELGIARMVRNYQIEFNYPTENAFKSLLISVPNIPLKFKFTDLDY